METLVPARPLCQANTALRENHSGMETVEPSNKGSMALSWLRENHSGMETLKNVQHVYYYLLVA